MTTGDVRVNTPAIAWAWLTHGLARLDELPGRSLLREWTALKNDRDGQGTKMAFITDWPSDYWIAKTQRRTGTTLEAFWAIPDKLDQWTTLGLQDLIASTRFRGKRTNSSSFLDFLSRTDPKHIESDGDSIHRFHEALASITRHGDSAMISANQIRAWITVAFGDLLGGLALTPTQDDRTRGLLVSEVSERISRVDSLRGDDIRSSTDYGCEILYNTSVTEDGLRLASVRQGQGQEWQDHWAWLSVPQDTRTMSATLELAGLLLMNEPLFEGLTSTSINASEDTQKRTLCVMRRWLMTTKALAWTFEALQHDWADIRPQDLACFAFSALSPAWPRRVVAVSHRSFEAKPVLSTLKMWESAHVAIDASYVPAWETNTGMIWSLFAPVPLIARVESPAYLESEWCRRENEMLEYLVDRADFLDGRAVVDFEVDQLAEFDNSLFADGAQNDSSARLKAFPAPTKEFPPLSMALVGGVPLLSDLTILRAAGALRLIHALVRDPMLANELANRAAAGDDIDIVAPTNNPDGWVAYGDAFRDLARLLPNEPGRTSVSIEIPDDYSERDAQIDRLTAGNIPDLSTGNHSVADVLAALEWRRTVFEWFVGEGFGDKVLVDVGASDAREWTTSSHLSLARGLLALNRFGPIWIMQRADQNAHLWPGFRDQPIFTRHIEKQFSWLKPTFTEPTWLLYYLANSGLTLDSSLEAAMIAAVVAASGSEAVKLERLAEGASLVVPDPRSFFAIPRDALEDLSNLMVLADSHMARET